ncbi:Deoxyribose-phosphate aldolase [Penicillium brasilianum]|uniref:deoxyribose-phosphate aldolase n=1 Tax=Penicillium brasilianum TaxID=104259 RepID=A0A1S9R8T0_PENBI|nr:Deoxyribose-phosphate aldolase [Penicillium brasilianum]
MSSIPSTDAEWAVVISLLKDRGPPRPSSPPASPLGIPAMIDHTLLKEPIEPQQIDTLCQEARENNFATVCVRLGFVARAAANLKDKPNVGVACVVGFPEGTYDTSDKVKEAREAVEQGANELDMVINYPKLKNGQYTAVYDDILAVRRAAPAPVLLKAIIEASELDRDEIIAATIISCMAGVDFVKTSTGYKGPASVDHVTTMRMATQAAGYPTVRIKASGGIRNATDSLKMVKAGATRIGASAGVNIVRELEDGEILEQGAGHAVY